MRLVVCLKYKKKSTWTKITWISFCVVCHMSRVEMDITVKKSWERWRKKEFLSLFHDFTLNFAFIPQIISLIPFGTIFLNWAQFWSILNKFFHLYQNFGNFSFFQFFFVCYTITLFEMLNCIKHRCYFCFIDFRSKREKRQSKEKKIRFRN